MFFVAFLKKIKIKNVFLYWNCGGLGADEEKSICCVENTLDTTCRQIDPRVSLFFWIKTE